MCIRQSTHGHSLAFTGRCTEPVITVELYEKWYDLQIVHPNNPVIEAVPFPDEPEEFKITPPYVDHVPNPRVVLAWARRKGYLVDPLAMELMVGRWEIDVLQSFEAVDP